MATHNEPYVGGVSPGRLWFGLAGPAIAWLALGFIDLLIVWFACAYEEEYMGNAPHPYARGACFILAVVLLFAASAAGATSYRNWRKISIAPPLPQAAAAEVRKFIAFIGIIISVTLGAGIVWLALPPLLIQFCARTK